MSADVQIKTYRPFRQEVVDNRIHYHVLSESESYSIGSQGAEKIISSRPSADVLKALIAPYEYHENPSEASDIRIGFQNILESFSQIFSPEQDFEKIYSALFVLGSYSFQRFNVYPNLWLFIPRMHKIQTAETLFKGLCFNGISTNHSYCNEAIVNCIESFHPTLVLQYYRDSKNNRQDFLLSSPNTKDFILLSKDLEIAKLYCPKIVISCAMSSSMLQQSTLPIVVNHSIAVGKQPLNYEEVRGSLCSISIAIQDTLSKYLPLFDPHDISSPIRCLGRTFVEWGAIDELRYNLFDEKLAEKEKETKHHEQNSFAYGVLFGIHEFLKQNKTRYYDGYIPLGDIVEYLQEMDIIGRAFDARLLSRFINQYRLLCAPPKRKRIPGGIFTKPTVSVPNPAMARQVTSVKIDELRLNQLVENESQNQRLLS